jgi:hypothetical protein
MRQRLAEATAGKHRLSRDLGSCSIFDFFDSIGQMQTTIAVQPSNDSSYKLFAEPCLEPIAPVLERGRRAIGGE